MKTHLKVIIQNKNHTLLLTHMIQCRGISICISRIWSTYKYEL